MKRIATISTIAAGFILYSSTIFGFKSAKNDLKEKGYNIQYYEVTGKKCDSPQIHEGVHLRVEKLPNGEIKVNKKILLNHKK